MMAAVAAELLPQSSNASADDTSAANELTIAVATSYSKALAATLNY